VILSGQPASGWAGEAVAQPLLGGGLIARGHRAVGDGSGISQIELAELMGVRQATISKIERRHDLSVSTLRRIVQALGGVLEVTVRFPDWTIAIDLEQADDDD
jgi:plasmid maintenance system antidote protein VapI